MSLGDKAVEMHVPGVNCAQCVLCSAEEYIGIDRETAMKVASGFGGGMRCGEVCGCLTGAIIALGLCGKEKLGKSFADTFKEDKGAIRCRTLKRNKVPCNELIKYAGDRLEEVLNNGNL